MPKIKYDNWWDRKSAENDPEQEDVVKNLKYKPKSVNYLVFDDNRIWTEPTDSMYGWGILYNSDWESLNKEKEKKQKEFDDLWV